MTVPASKRIFEFVLQPCDAAHQWRLVKGSPTALPPDLRAQSRHTCDTIAPGAAGRYTLGAGRIDVTGGAY